MMIRRAGISLFAVSCLLVIAASAVIPKMPMTATVEDSIVYHWLHKPVLENRLLDDMENLSSWEHTGTGEMQLSSENIKSGSASIKITSQTFTVTPSTSGRPPGECTARFKVNNENWNDFNRLSFWVYPDLPGFNAVTMTVALNNEGTFRVPDEYNRLGRNYFMLQNQEWNQIVCEIPHLSRDKVTGVQLSYRMQGNEPGATNIVCYYLDHLELQKVNCDNYEGWNVASGEISYSHTGYAIEVTKSALACDLKAKEFKVIDIKTQQPVLTKAISEVAVDTGKFQIMDFTEIKQPGMYCLEAGNLKTKPFLISPNVWEGTAWKTINLFYCLRCGTNIPGIHSTCHADWLAEYDGKKIAYNGGWHDAGDLSQGLNNTCEATYSLFLLAERMGNTNPALHERLLEEACWGLEWVMKNRFGNGFRCRWGTMDFYTDNIIGTTDDMITKEVGNDPFLNLQAAAVEAIAARLLKNNQPALAERCLRFAREDWQYAVNQIKDQRLESISTGVLTAVELFKSTEDKAYLQKAVEWADGIVSCQQKEKTGWDVPLSGFFYRNPEKQQIFHCAHVGNFQMPIVALAELSELLPNHEKRAEWIETVRLYGEYVKTVARFTEPYSMLPESIYSVEESKDQKFIEQVKNGIRLSDKYYLRRFPVWFDFRGNYGVLLSHTRAISSAAWLLKDKELWDLTQKQLQWVVGKNPFCQSTMYGEGHDFAPQYTVTSGDIVGGLPVGIQSSRNFDAPFWPSDNCYNYKEIWVHPSARWLAILADLEKCKKENWQ